MEELRKIPAAIALVFGLFSWSLISVSLFAIPWYCDRRNRRYVCPKLSTRFNIRALARDMKCSRFINLSCKSICSSFVDDNVDCSKAACKPAGAETRDGWQDFIEYTWLVGFVVSTMTVLMQIFFFWPMVLMGKVLNIILIVVYLLDIIAGFLKAIAAFGIMRVSIEINDNYAWFEPNALEINTLPGALCLFSMIFSFLTAMMLMIATDVRPRDQETYLETIQKQAEEQERLDRISRTPSQFIPATDIVLSRVASTGSTSI